MINDHILAKMDMAKGPSRGLCNVLRRQSMICRLLVDMVVDPLQAELLCLPSRATVAHRHVSHPTSGLRLDLHLNRSQI
jgi:hypothetical protein